LEAQKRGKIEDIGTDFDFFEAVFPNRPEKMEEKELSSIPAKNLRDLSQKLGINIYNNNRILNHDVLVQKVIEKQNTSVCATRSTLKSIESVKEMEKREFSTATKAQIVTICEKMKMNAIGTKEEIWKKVKLGAVAESVSKNQKDDVLLQVFCFVKVFASNCVFYQQEHPKLLQKNRLSLLPLSQDRNATLRTKYPDYRSKARR